MFNTMIGGYKESPPKGGLIPIEPQIFNASHRVAAEFPLVPYKSKFVHIFSFKF